MNKVGNAIIRQTTMTKERLMYKIKIVSISLIVLLALVFGLIYMQATTNTVNNFPTLDYASEPVPDFNQYERVQEKKRAFFDYLKPAIASQNEYIATVRSLIFDFQALHLADQELSAAQQEELDWLITEYRVKNIEEPGAVYTELLRKVDVIPADLVLAQTANESAWGTSRFARKGYNFFGIWCFEEGCGFVPKQRIDGAAHEVAKFDDLSEGMYSYMRNLNSHPAYKDLRAIRLQLSEDDKKVTGHALAEGLIRYSERGEEYIEELRQMIRVNKTFMATDTTS
jgi:Bax protein